MKTPPIVSPEAWEAARLEMLAKEKAFTRARDRLAAERRRMPWMRVEKARINSKVRRARRASSTCSKTAAN
jgi:predicted dithiol-disulfide oxidoreductase (DUF899 family)